MILLYDSVAYVSKMDVLLQQIISWNVIYVTRISCDILEHKEKKNMFKTIGLDMNNFFSFQEHMVAK